LRDDFEEGAFVVGEQATKSITPPLPAGPCQKGSVRGDYIARGSRRLKVSRVSEGMRTLEPRVAE
jgi:hypothetical protein